MSRAAAGYGRALVVTVALLIPTSVQAQQWAWVDAVGYGGVGVGLGAMATWDTDLEPARGQTVVALSGVGGMVIGALVGGAADRRLAREEELSDAHTAAVVFGSVMAGATAGALLSAAFIEGEGTGTPLGSDESTFVGLTVGGSALGAVLTWVARDALRPRAVTATPTVSAGGDVEMRVQVRF